MNKLFIFVMLLIAGCEEVHNGDPYSPTKLTSKERREIIHEVKTHLRDSDSAKIKLSELVTPKTGIHFGIPTTYCGLVNAKNGFGAYAGDTPFLLKLTWERDGSFVAAFQGVKDSYLEDCVERGYFWEYGK